MNIHKLFNTEIQDELEQLKGMEVGTEAYKNAVDGITKLADRSIEMERLANEHDEKLAQAKEDKKARWIRDGITIGTALLGATVTIWGTLKSFEFEKEGTVTTIMGRGFVNKLLPKK